MFEKLKNRIFILSSVRTGSSALVWEIYDYFKSKGIICSTFFEPDIIGYNKKFDSRKQMLSESELRNIVESESFILKVHSLDLERYYPRFIFKYLDDTNYSIVKIQRRNLVDQCVSLYISETTDIWTSTKNNNISYEDLLIPIDTVKIYKTISTTYAYNESLAKVQRSDLCIDYEDFNFQNKEILKNSKVKNYNELKSVITRMLNSQYIKKKFNIKQMHLPYQQHEV